MWYGKAPNGKVEHFGAGPASSNEIPDGNALCGKFLPLSYREDAWPLSEAGKLRQPTCKPCKIKFHIQNVVERMTQVTEEKQMAAAAKKTAASKDATEDPAVVEARAKITELIEKTKEKDADLTQIAKDGAEAVKGIANARTKAQVKSPLNNAIAEAKPKPAAKKTAAKKTAAKVVTSTSLATQDYKKLPSVVELVGKAATTVQETAQHTVKGAQGAYQTAAYIFDMREQMDDKDGNPDIKATSQGSRDAAEEAYKEGGISLAGLDKESDQYRERNKIQLSIRGQMDTVRVQKIRLLDADEERAKRYSKIQRNEGEALSKAVFRHYGLDEMSRLERKNANNQLEAGTKKAEKEAKEAEATAKSKKTAPEAKAVAFMNQALKAFETMPVETVKAADKDGREQIRGDAESMIGYLRAIIKAADEADADDDK